jgi:hypothetical protein
VSRELHEASSNPWCTLMQQDLSIVDLENRQIFGVRQ